MAMGIVKPPTSPLKESIALLAIIENYFRVVDYSEVIRATILNEGKISSAESRFQTTYSGNVLRPFSVS